ncbi:hypothetical protein [Mucilaginibacter sp.]|jgi:CheY-like chemotaxis protein|uniref:response regulator n=1 Tax=Mucilaginibacter sp. TaxID=1882438 RepID=UPI002B960DE2|nr:hypothetical protein [Mucilaginibacter sp.]HTI60270.1 hypothetical protein [Mucilaginibacter sp.]
MNKLTYIDDCQLDHFILRKLLSRFGSPVEIRCTGSGSRIMDQLSQNYADEGSLPDIILLDIAYQQGFDAWEFLDQLRSLYPRLAKPIDVYILSATKYPADLLHLEKYDFVKAFIMKPITKEALQKIIRHREMSVDRFAFIEAYN